MAEFFAMGGYGTFVWASYGVTAIAIVVNFIWSIQRRKAVLRRLREPALETAAAVQPVVRQVQ